MIDRDFDELKKYITTGFDVLSDYWYYQYQPANAIRFDVTADNSLLPGQTNVTIISYTVPVSINRGVLRYIGIGADDSTFFSFAEPENSSWYVTVNGAALSDFPPTSVQRGTLADPTPVVVPLAGGDIIQILASITMTGLLWGGVSITGRLKGWFW